MADKRGSVGEITVSVNVDAEEAITALKAIQREAKKATQALRELDNLTNGNRKGTVEIDGIDGRELAKIINQEQKRERNFSR